MVKGRDFKNSMLAYCKLILQKMSFSKKLFLKEYRKSFSYLSEEEKNELRKWVRDTRTNVDANPQPEPSAVRVSE
jgi:hypothetical protein